MKIFDKNLPFTLDMLIETANNEGAMLLIDKDSGWTSFDVVAKLRGLTHIKKIGHAGTLDPLATGLLIVCIGKKATKEIDSFQAMNKIYSAEFKLGATTKTDDSEYEEENVKVIGNIELDTIKKAISKFIGKIEQIPPDFSAKKIEGKSAYKLARKNREVVLKPSQIEIFSFDIVDLELPLINAEIICSKGTYIRSIARDLGKELGCGAYLKNLRRKAIGNYDVELSFAIKDLIELANNQHSET